MVTQELRTQQVRPADGHAGTLEVTCLTYPNTCNSPSKCFPNAWLYELYMSRDSYASELYPNMHSRQTGGF